jgi:hypothetical protein
VKGSLGLEEIAKPVSIPKKRAQEKKTDYAEKQ